MIGVEHERGSLYAGLLVITFGSVFVVALASSPLCTGGPGRRFR